MSHNQSYHREYHHLQFRKQWVITKKASFYLGQCQALVAAINNTPITPQHYEKLMMISMIKGAQATTAIEGNTLTEREIEKLIEGKNLPPSKEYQEIEVKNILEALHTIFREIYDDHLDEFICSDLLKRFHKLVGKDLGDHFAAIPGEFRNADVVVGKYRCPDYRDVPLLVDEFCDWLRQEFGYKKRQQEYWEIIIQAIVSHVYIEWIHPFGDGNGRTGRLIEFYILVRGGTPNIGSHILSNHYNLTRTEYYRQLENAYHKQDLTEFIEYALLGFRDGLQSTLEVIQESQFLNSWHKYIYDVFDSVKIIKREVFKRRRTLALELPIDRRFTLEEVPEISFKLARLYSNMSERTILRDLEELQHLNLVKKEGSKYTMRIDVLNMFIALKRNQQNSPRLEPTEI